MAHVLCIHTYVDATVIQHKDRHIYMTPYTQSGPSPFRLTLR